MFEKIFTKVIWYTIYTCWTVMALGAATRSVKRTVDTMKGKDEV